MTLKELIEGKHLSIQRQGNVRFGRTLAYVRIRGGADVGEMLIMAGVAVEQGPARLVRIMIAAVSQVSAF
jgi:endonuclease YncB( thermonuclease family)